MCSPGERAFLDAPAFAVGRLGSPGWVMSDRGATDDWEYALHALDQESGVQLDAVVL